MTWAGEYQLDAVLTGSASGLVGVKILDAPAFGVIRGIQIGSDPSGNLTSITTLLLVRNVNTLTFPPSSRPGATLEVVEVSSVAVLTGADDASLDSVLDYPRAFRDGLGLMAVVVASGAFSLPISIEVGALRSPVV